jgi:hypothetical protein
MNHHEQAFHFSILHIKPITRFRVVASHTRQPAESKLVVFGRLRAVPGLQQADNVLIKIAPPSGFAAMTLHVLLQAVRVAFPKWHWDITRQNVVERGNVR